MTEPTVTALTLRPGLPSDEQAPETPCTNPLPPRYSTALARAVIARIKKGNYPETAALAEGVPTREFAAWRRQYSEGKAHPELASFIEAVDQGEAFAEAEAVEELSTSPSLDLKFKVLQARFANRWSAAERKAVDSEMEYVFNKLRVHLTPPEFARIVDVLAIGDGK